MKLLGNSWCHFFILSKNRTCATYRELVSFPVDLKTKHDKSRLTEANPISQYYTAKL